MSGMVIIGAGECGTRAAFALRETGYDGHITLFGAEPGLPYERPPLSKPNSDGTCLKPICDDAALGVSRIAYVPGVEILSIDRENHTVVHTNGSQSFDKLLLATGARARGLDCPGAELTSTFRTHTDADRLYREFAGKRRVLIVGAGLIGFELAAYLTSKGTRVTIAERGNRPMNRAVPEPLVERLIARHIENGIKLLLNTEVACVEVGRVEFVSGTTIEVDAVVVAIGVIPNTALAEAAGLTVDNGILVNDRLQTSDPDIFAAGDCAVGPSVHASGLIRLESWRNARQQGDHVAGSMLGAKEPFRAIPWFWSDQFDLGLQVSGTWNGSRQTISRHTDDSTLLFQLSETDTLTCVAGIGPGAAIAKDIRIAERLIEKAGVANVAALSDPSVNLKTLLKA